MFDYLWALLESNDLAAGGAVLMVLGYVGHAVRALPERIYEAAKRRFLFVVEIRNEDPLFDWLENWLAQHAYARKARKLYATSANQNEDRDDYYVDDGRSWNRPTVRLTPGTGWHILKHAAAFVLLERTREDAGTAESAFGLRTRESFTLTTPIWWAPVVRELLVDVRDTFYRTNRDHVRVFSSRCSYWSGGLHRRKRDLSSVIMANGLAEQILDDVVSFTNALQRYTALGVPYHRGYLLDGPPGNGKSSLVTAIASTLDRDIYVLSPKSVENDSALAELMANVPPGSIIVIEDIDSCIPTRAASEDKDSTKGVTFSGVLNCLDGPLSAEGQIVFMTTNHAERLDPALLRPGRVDLRFTICPPTDLQLVKLHERFYPGKEQRATEFAARGATSMAEAQGVLLVQASEEGIL